MHDRLSNGVGDPLAPLSDLPDEQTRQLNDLIDQLIVNEPRPYDVGATAFRLHVHDHPNRPVVKVDEAEERAIAGPAGPIPLRVFLPPEVNGVYLHIHGGGWTIGSHDTQDPFLWQRAQEASAAVVSVGYRLAPEHPYPAANDDCEAAARWLVEHAEDEFGTDRIVVGGESAGAHLAVATMVRLRDRHGFSDFRGAELRYGLYDLRGSPSVRNHDDAGMLDRRSIDWFVDQFLGAADREDPDVSPIFADLRDLPPALLTCGTFDPVLDDTLQMWTRWRAAGNGATLRLHAGAGHGFDLVPVAAGPAALTEIARFVRERVA